MSDDFVRQNTADQDKKLDAEKLQINGLDVYRFRSSVAPMAVRVDQSNPMEIYVGEALPGTADNSAGWRIKKLLTSGLEKSMLYADGDTAFDNVWADRASLTYL